ncbi:hypothetical protein D3C77_707190 [compost metagenome]
MLTSLASWALNKMTRILVPPTKGSSSKILSWYCVESPLMRPSMPCANSFLNRSAKRLLSESTKVFLPSQAAINIASICRR